jgi:uncharacterized membrane protein
MRRIRLEGACGMANEQTERTVVGVFRSEREAEQAIKELHDQGFTEQEISLIGPDQRRSGRTFGDQSLSEGTTWGAGIGGAAGLLAGAGALAIPGFGPLLAMGPLAAALTGAATGGIAGGLVDWGIPEAEGRRLEEEVKRGEFLAVVRTKHDADKAERILRNHGAHDVDKR